MNELRNRRTTTWLAGAACLALTLVACGDGDESGTSATLVASTTSAPAATTAPTPAERDEADVDQSADEPDDAAAEASDPDDGDAPATTAATASTEPPGSTEPSASTQPVATTPPPATTEPAAADQPLAERLREAARTTLALTTFDAVVIAEQQTPTRTERIVGTAAFDYVALVGTVEFTLDENGMTDAVTVVADGDSFWIRVLDRDVDRLPPGTPWITGPASLLRAESAQFDSTNTLGVLAGLLVVDDVESLGADTTLDGVPVERFRSIVDYDAAYEADRDLSSMYSVSLRDEDAVMVIDVAIDADGLVREFRAVASSEAAPELDASYELTVTDPGTAIGAPEPPDPTLVATGPEADAVRADYFE